MNNTQIYPILVTGDNTKLWMGLSSVGVAIYDIATNPASPSSLATLASNYLVAVPATGDYTSGVTGFCTRSANDVGVIGGWIVANGVNYIVAYTYASGTITSTPVVTGSTGESNALLSCWVDSISNKFFVTGTASTTHAGITGFALSASSYSASDYYDIKCPFIIYAGAIAGTAIGYHATQAQCNCAASVCQLAALAYSPTNFVTSVTGQDSTPYISITEGLYTKPLATLSNVIAPVVIANPLNGCSTITNTIPSGSICMVFRGACAFETKIQNCMAANAGIVAVAIALNPGDEVATFVMSTPVVPTSAFAISNADGTLIQNYLTCNPASLCSTPSTTSAGFATVAGLSVLLLSFVVARTSL